MDGIVFLRWLEAFIPPLTFLFILWDSTEPENARWRTKTGGSALLLGGLALQILLASLGLSLEQIVALFPITWYIPAILYLFLCSKDPFFAKALLCLFSLLSIHLLMALEKLLTYLHTGLGGLFWLYIFGAIELISAVFLAVIAHFHLKEPFRACAGEADSGWLPLLALPAMLLALYSYFLTSTTDVIVLILLFFYRIIFTFCPV